MSALLRRLRLLWPLLLLQACAGLSEPVELDSSNLHARVLLEAERLVARGDRDEARRLLDEVLKESPRHVPAHRLLQNIGLEEHEEQALHRRYKELLESDPEEGAYHYLFGRLLHRREDQQRAFEEAADQSPGLVWGHYGLAWLASTSGDLDEARAQVERALSCEPGHALSRALLARLLLLQQEPREARLVLEQLLREQPEFTEGWSLLASAAQMQSDPDLEIRARERCLELDPRLEEDRDRLVDLALSPNSSAVSFLAADALHRQFQLHLRTADAGWCGAMSRLYLHEGRLEEARFLAERAYEGGRREPALRPVLENGRTWLETRLAYYELSREELAPSIRDLLDLDTSREGFAARLREVEMLFAAGFIQRAAITGRRLEVEHPENEELRRLMTRIGRHRRLEARLRLLSDMLAGEGEASLQTDMEAFLRRVAELIEEETGYDAGKGNRVLAVPLVGEALDSTVTLSRSINGYFRRSNQILFAGRLAGGRVQALLFTTLSGPRELRPVGWTQRRSCQEVIGALSVMRPRNELFGDSGGRALFGGYYLDLDILIPGKARLESPKRWSTATKARVLADPGIPAANDRERRDISWPGSAADALILTALEIHGSLPFVDQVRVHEQGHLVDSLNYLPIFPNLLPNLGLVFRSGFSAKAVMAELEAAAQLYALKYGPSPHLALAEMVRLIPRGPEAGPHGHGYQAVLQAFIDELALRIDDHPVLDPNYRLLHQLHRLSEAEIRLVAAEL